MDYFDFVEAVDIDKVNPAYNYQVDQLANSILIRTKENKTSFFLDATVKVVIIGVEEDRGNVENFGAATSPDFFRSYFYKLYNNDNFNSIADIGNIKAGNQLTDTYFAVKKTFELLVKDGFIPILIGGTKDLTFANFQAYQNLEQSVNLVAIDSAFAIGQSESAICSSNYLSKIILHQPNFLFNYSNIGYQSYFIGQHENELIESLFFDTYRLGFVRTDIHNSEPIIRNADFISFDISAIKQSDAPATTSTSPNGLRGDEACQLARYAGLSDKLSSIGFYGVNPTVDRGGQTSHLLAQMVWYFIDGVNNRKNDFPACNKQEYLKYTVSMESQKDDVIFYKSEKSDRWYMDVPYPNTAKSKYERHLLVPCSYKDYQIACSSELPDRWVQTFKKLL